MTKGKKVDLTGMKINEVEVLGETRLSKTKYVLELKCHCGNNFEARKDRFKNKEIRSCGCLPRGKYKGKHGKYKERIYKIFFGIKERCYNENHSSYKDYGARDIKMCNEWLEVDGFLAFEKWSYENGYSDDLSIDRIDVNGNYDPLNCRWATNKEQARNKRNTWYEMFNGKKIMIAEFCEEYGLNMNTIGVRKSRGKSNDDLFIGLTCTLAQGPNKINYKSIK